MKNLNKLNYFTPTWHARFTLAAPFFCKWVDQYKEEVSWEKLFNHIYGSDLPAPKFHDIPFELQYGILKRFFRLFKIDVNLEIIWWVLNKENKKKMFKVKQDFTELDVAFKIAERKLKEGF